MKKVFYEIREYKTPVSYSSPLGVKLRPRWRCIRLIARLTATNHRDIVMVPFHVNCKG